MLSNPAVNPSRAATDELLAGLRAGRWRPAAWARFAASAARRSAQQAARHPRALAEATVLHAVLALLAGRSGRWRVAASWVMAASHLGLLGTRRSLGAANVITLIRANLPAVGGPARWLPALALASDLADGRIARRAGTVTAFGSHADSLADATFWTWYTLRHETSRPIRIAALAAWTAPVIAVTSASIARGQMTDPPRPAMLRPAAAMQAAIATRAAQRPPAGRWRDGVKQPGRHVTLPEPAGPGPPGPVVTRRGCAAGQEPPSRPPIYHTVTSG